MKSQTPVWQIVAIGAAMMMWVSFLTTGWQPVEDSHIFYRYSANLAEGHGLVFNSQERVEGITSLLWPILLTAGGWLTIDTIPRWAIILELVCAVTIITLIGRARRHDPFLPWLIIVLAVLPGWPDTIGVGMETMLCALLITSGFLAIEKKSPAIGSTLLGLAFTARPDMALLGGLILLKPSWVEKKNRQMLWRLWSPFLIIVMGTEGWRLTYYGDWLPNTFYAKAGLDLSADIRLGLGALGEYLRRGGWLAIALIASALWQKLWWPSATIGCWLIYYVVVGGPTGNQARFIAPILPVLLLTGWPAKKPQIVTIVLLAILAGGQNLTYWRNHIQHQKTISSYDRVSAATANLPAGSSLAFQAIGQVGWQNRQIKIIDPLGLVNRDVAKRGERHPEIPIQGHRTWMTADQFFQEKPDWYIPFVTGVMVKKINGQCPMVFANPARNGPDDAILRDIRLPQRYELIGLDGVAGECVLAFRKKLS